ncbi:hypothetical protein ACFFX1_13650 [Dactylosporangium sucinum]|uniref:EcsC family protein n=1 Tax=Dactylosporangium sucinum TaxID=1424081 RepID=A0A917UB22_9ACTN|nr:hypothetical protein [Dactylosporangium sucinum]GGM74609.1 hypothetical protein GCM10007977_090280 [Dactylosporangium sucinum]
MVQSVPADEAAENEPVAEAELSNAVSRLTEEDTQAPERRRLLGRIMRVELRERGVKDLFRPKKAINWITDAVTRVAPHVQVRDLETLRAHHGGLEGDQLAERLIRNASRVTAGIGAAGGGVAAVEWAVTPTLMSAPVLLAAETVAVVAVEMKLIGELHAVYGQPVQGTGTQRAVALIQAWAQRRGVNPMRVGGSVAAAMGTALRKELRDRILRRFGRNLSSLGPLLTGAAIGGFLNRRATLALGADIRKDLKASADPRVIEG